MLMIRERKVLYYDPMRKNIISVADSHIQNIFRMTLSQITLLSSGGLCLQCDDSWSAKTLDFEVPTQQNSYDCGLYVCIFAECLARKIPVPTERLKDETLRSRMRMCILTQLCADHEAQDSDSEAAALAVQDGRDGNDDSQAASRAGGKLSLKNDKKRAAVC